MSAAGHHAPRPVGTRSVVEYVFDIPGEGERGFTFEALADLRTLTRVCGNSPLWLMQSFPATTLTRYDGSGCQRRVASGVDVTAAANYCAGLCIDAEQARIRAANLAQARHAPGPVDHARAWWNRLLIAAGLRSVKVDVL